MEQIEVRPLAEHVQSSLAGTTAMLTAVEAVVAPVFMVGGGVRDAAMGRPLKDYDFATPLATSQIEERVRSSGHRAYTAGRRFGTIGFKMHGSLIQVSTFRGQAEGAAPARSDRQVLVALEKDLSHRDFTVNAMAVARGTIVDPFGGLSDLRDGVLRAVGSPRSRISEDPIRLLRAARFVSELGFVVEAGTRAEMMRSAHKILNVAGERVSAELDGVLVGECVADALRFLADTDLLRYVLPELALQVGFDQNSAYHDRTLFEHTVATIAGVPSKDLSLRWGALLHDVGKPFVRRERTGRSTYVHHELLGAAMVERIGAQFRWSNARCSAVRQLVLEHMRDDSPLKDADNAAKRAAVATLHEAGNLPSCDVRQES